jgi:hypothetical protein
MMDIKDYAKLNDAWEKSEKSFIEEFKVWQKLTEKRVGPDVVIVEKLYEDLYREGADNLTQRETAYKERLIELALEYNLEFILESFQVVIYDDGGAVVMDYSEGI